MRPDPALRVPLRAQRVELEATVLRPTLGRRLDQRDFAGFLVEAVQHAVGVVDRALAEALVAPDLLAGHQILADPAVAVRMAVDVPVDPHHAAVMVLHHLVVLVDGLDRVPVVGDLHQLAADAVARRGVHVAGVRDDRGDHRDAAGELGTPEHLSRRRIDAEELLGHQLHDLRLAGLLEEHGRRVLRLVGQVFRAPDDVAGELVERGHRPLRTAGRAEQVASDHERRFGVAPALELPAEVGDERLLPTDLAILGRCADEQAVAADGVDAVAVHGGRHARAVAPAVRISRPGRSGPRLLAGRDVDGDEELLLAAQPHGVEAAVGDREARVAEAGVLEEPHLSRSAGGPGLQEPGVGRMVIAGGAAPLGPIGRAQGGATDQEGTEEGRGLHRMGRFGFVGDVLTAGQSDPSNGKGDPPPRMPAPGSFGRRTHGASRR